jgi:type IV pilus assembly protein PilY1
VGTGHRAKPFDVSPADTFFSLRDSDAFNALPQAAYDSYDIITPADLVDVSGQTQTVISQSDRGWKFTLPPNEKILAGSLTFNNEIFFVAFEPNSEAAVACGHKRGTNYLYRVNVINGDPIVPNIETLSPALSDAARRQTLAQGGIAPSPTFLFPSPDPDCTGEACSPPPIGCVGVECFDPGFENFPVRTLWTQDGVE